MGSLSKRTQMVLDEQQLLESYLVMVDEIRRAKPSSAKGRYIKSLAISSTMSPGVRIDPTRPKGMDAPVVEWWKGGVVALRPLTLC